jgi:hydrogenase-4 component E
VSQPIAAYLVHLNAMAGGLFLLAGFAVIATRQMLACLHWFVAQALLLAASATLIGTALGSAHLLAVAGITVFTKTIATPWLLRRTVRQELYRRRELSQVLNIPTSLLLAAGLTLLAYAITHPLTAAIEADPFVAINLPVGLAGLFLGACTVAVRREALSQLLGLLVMENGAFFVAVAIAPDLPLIAELAVAFDVPITTLVIGLLTRRIHEQVGGTPVGLLAALRER